MDRQKVRAFRWTNKASEAARRLADGETFEAVAQRVGVGEATLYRWKKNHPEFGAEIDRLTLLTGMSTRAVRVREAKRIVADKLGKSEKDLLDWLKYLQSETDGTKFDSEFLAKLVAAFGSAGGVQPDAFAEDGGSPVEGSSADGQPEPGSAAVDAVAPAVGTADDGVGEQGG